MIAEALTCLALAVYYEARSEPADAQLAVAEVVINRRDDPRYPDTVCGVVQEDRGPAAHDCQFSFMCDGKPERPQEYAAWQRARHVAAQAMSGDVLGHGATHYHAANVRPFWADHLTHIGQIGSHIFYVSETYR